MPAATIKKPPAPMNLPVHSAGGFYLYLPQVSLPSRASGKRPKTSIIFLQLFFLHFLHHSGHLAARNHLHHLTGLVELLQQTVDFLNVCTTTLGNSCTA